MAAPRKHPPKDAESTIERLAAQGFSIIGIAKHLGVSRETFKRWCEDDDSLQEAFEIGRETERQALHALIVQSAVANKPANVNAFFILKSRHGYRENDTPNTNVNVAVAASPVMIVKDFGTDEQWAAKAAAQQRALTMPATATPQLQASHVASQPSYGPPAYVAPTWEAPESVAVPSAPAWTTHKA